MNPFPFIKRGPATRRRRRLAVAAGTAVAAVAVTVVAATGGLPASAATGTTIVGVGSNRCLDVVADSHADHALVNIYDCINQENQLWTYTSAQELRVYDTMCLDVKGQATESPAVAQIYTCNGGDNQKWKINSNGTITGVQSGLCLDVTGQGTANSTLVGVVTCNGQSNQQWKTTQGNADGQPPSVPANPRTSDLLCDSVTFSWDAATDNVGVAFYDVYHDGQLMKTVSGSTLSTDLTVVPGVTWGLYVNARDAAGNVSQASTTVPITPPQCAPDSEPPTAPQQLAATASGTTVTPDVEGRHGQRRASGRTTSTATTPRSAA